MHIKEVISQFNNEVSRHNMVNTGYNYDHMVYVRLFEGCNLHCEHCFIPSNPKKINDDFYDNHQLTQQLVDYGRVRENSRLYLQWHGGEPTLLGVDYLKNAIEKVQSDSRFFYMHGIQTNLMNFHENTEKWVDLYKTHFDSHLGISWDFAIRHTKVNSLTPEQTNERFESRFWDNVTLAQSYGLKLYMVVTATKVLFEHFKNPFDFFEMMAEKGITHLNFERITKTGYARSSWEKLGLSNAEYSHYMSKFFKAYILFKDNNPDIELNVSPFDGLLQSVIGMAQNNILAKSDKAGVWDVLSYKNQGYGCWSGECDTRFHTIDSNGYKHGCTALTSEQDNNNKTLKASIEPQKIVWIGKIGRKNKDSDVSVSDNHHEHNQRDTILEQRQVRQQSCQGCEFLSICSSGCLSVEKFDESGECSGAKPLFATIHRAVLNALSTQTDKLEQIA